MRAAASLLILVLGLASCSDEPRQAAPANAAATDIEALPPDESMATPSDELASGAAEPAVNSVDNAY